ncbi:MAG TPA: iron ABC transporter permease [Treponemataceae bacterium]|nr:iron ABC transporter permease [Treponemataceae bacterium]HPS45174.1 iron ABC transporter permease [Treponemataceae bacterium]
MPLKTLFALTLLLSLLVVLAGAGLGSVFVSPAECARILIARVSGAALPADIPPLHAGIVWDIRLPRVLLAWLAGASLSVSGAVMQSVLKNPLASSFTLGVSSGASLGAGIVILYGATLPLASSLSVPAAAFAASVLSIILVMRFSRAIDPGLENNTIILSGMILSLFVNAVLTTLSALARTELARLVFWQMGSFALRGWTPVAILFPTLVAGAGFILFLGKELDIMTFGDAEATAIGVNVARTKRALVLVTSALTGCAVAFAGVIGFVDLAVPHIVRRALGPAHRSLIPFSALLGGAIMVIADLVARTAIPPLDLPVGAITAILGAPFFAWVYVSSRRSAP